MRGFWGKTYKNPYKRGDKTVRDKLSDELYIWDYYYHKQKTIVVDRKRNKKKTIKLSKDEWKLSPVKHTPIVSKKVFDAAQVLLEEKRWHNSRNKSYLLSGLLKCNCCKHDKAHGMVSRVGTMENWTRNYKCWWKNYEKYKGHICPTTPLHQEALDLLVKTEIKSLIKDPQKLVESVFKKQNMESYKDQLSREIERISKSIQKHYRSIKNAKAMMLDGDIDFNKEEYMDLKKHVEESINKLQGDQIQIQEELEAYFDMEEQGKAFDYLRQVTSMIDEVFEDEAKCKKLFKNLIEEIVVYSEYDPDIVLSWRKKKWGEKQHIPHTIMIRFRLPQDFLNSIFITQDVIDINETLQSEWVGAAIKKHGDKKKTEKKKWWKAKKVKSLLNTGEMDYLEIGQKPHYI